MNEQQDSYNFMIGTIVGVIWFVIWTQFNNNTVHGVMVAAAWADFVYYRRKHQ